MSFIGFVSGIGFDTALRVVPYQKPLASSRHVTWWIKGAKILDILPRYPANMYRLYGTFFVWRCIRIKRKVTMPRVADRNV